MIGGYSMNDIILEMNLEISAYIYELHGLQQVIKELDADPNMDKIYFQEIADRYMSMCDKLRILLEAYFNESDKQGLPREFSYYKLYKQLVN